MLRLSRCRRSRSRCRGRCRAGAGAAGLAGAVGAAAWQLQALRAAGLAGAAGAAGLAGAAGTGGLQVQRGLAVWQVQRGWRFSRSPRRRWTSSRRRWRRRCRHYISTGLNSLNQSHNNLPFKRISELSGVVETEAQLRPLVKYIGTSDSGDLTREDP